MKPETRTKYEEWRRETAPETQTNSFNDRLMWLAWQAALASSDVERATETVRIQRKMLHYIAFVLTGDENGDAQLAADEWKGERERLRTLVTDLRTELEQMQFSIHHGGGHGSSAWRDCHRDACPKRALLVERALAEAPKL